MARLACSSSSERMRLRPARSSAVKTRPDDALRGKTPERLAQRLSAFIDKSLHGRGPGQLAVLWACRQEGAYLGYEPLVLGRVA
jgi:hypothetical protein